jgi:hypothetical protein
VTKREKIIPAKGYLPIKPSQPFWMTHRATLLMSILGLAALFSVFYVLSLPQATPQTTPVPLPEEKTPIPHFETDEGYVIPLHWIHFAGDVEGTNLARYQPKPYFPESPNYPHNRFDLYVCARPFNTFDPQWVPPDPPLTLTFHFGKTYRGTHTDGELLAISCDPLQDKALLFYRWAERYTAYELRGEEDYSISEDTLTYTLTLDYTIIRRRVDQNAWKTLWQATTPIVCTVTLEDPYLHD